MTDTQDKKSFLFYLNPYVWVKGLISYLVTFLLVINHFFVLILMCGIVLLVVLFGYDRYAFSTYDEAASSAYLVGSFASHEVYDSPLTRQNRRLSSDLSRHYETEKRIQAEAEAERKARMEIAKVSTAPEAKPIWTRQDDVSRSFIQAEVRERLAQIEKKVARKRK